ncbi:MAG: MFS transporter [Gammaproteobacteria bacterium]|nr:MAG: MFS transporter [Gammaproteobacteria bacterium]
MSTNTQNKIALRIIFFILLLDIMGVSMLWPVIAFIVRQYSNDALTLTLLTALYSGAQFFAAPFMGKLGDRFGRRPVLIISLLGSAFGYMLFGIGGALWVLLISRLIDGVTAGNQSVAAAYISDVSTPETRTKNFTLFGIAWGLGLIIGPAIGAVLGQINLSAPAYFAAILSIAAAVLTHFLLPESLTPENREKKPLTVKDLNPFTTIFYIIKQPALGKVLLVLCLFNFVFNGFSSTESLFLLDKFSVQPWQLGSLLALAGVALIAVQKAVPAGIKHFGHQGFAAICFVALATILVVTFVTPYFGWLYGVVSLRTMAAGVLFPVLGALMSSKVKPQEQGALMGVNTALSSATYVFGPLWAGAVYDHVMPSAPYWMGAIILIVAAIYIKKVNLGETPIGSPKSVAVGG